jgi:hypothetical protein
VGKKLPSRSVPKPKPMTAEEQAFVSDQTPTPPVPQGTKAGRNLVPRADGTERRRIAAYFSTELAKRLELHCVQTNRDLSDVIVAAVEQYLGASGH